MPPPRDLASLDHRSVYLSRITVGLNEEIWHHCLSSLIIFGLACKVNCWQGNTESENTGSEVRGLKENAASCALKSPAHHNLSWRPGPKTQCNPWTQNLRDRSQVPWTLLSSFSVLLSFLSYGLNFLHPRVSCNNKRTKSPILHLI